MKRIVFILLNLVGVSLNLLAQKPVEVALKLRDGSNVSGTTNLQDINLVTDYGKLIVPVKNVSAVKVGIPFDKTVYDKAKVYLGQLANSNEDMRKGAYNELIKLGMKAIPAICDFINDPKNQTEYTGEFTPDHALNELKMNGNIEDVSSTKDVITIDNEYVIGGLYEFQKLEVKTEYGTLSIPKEKIKSMEVMYMNADGGNELSFKLIASKNISTNQSGGWLKTGVMLKAGQKFSIIANGEITLSSLSNQKYHPDGSYETANGEKYKDTSGTDEYSAATYPSYGNVVYKIGENSADTHKAGAKFSGSAVSSGMLYLSIYETVYNAANTGSYTVKVILK